MSNGGQTLTISQGATAVLRIQLDRHDVGRLHGHPAGCDRPPGGGHRGQPPVHGRLPRHRRRRRHRDRLAVDLVDDDTPTVSSNLAGSARRRCARRRQQRKRRATLLSTRHTTGTLAHSYGADGAGTTLLTAAAACCRPRSPRRCAIERADADDQPDPERRCVAVLRIRSRTPLRAPTRSPSWPRSTTRRRGPRTTSSSRRLRGHRRRRRHGDRLAVDRRRRRHAGGEPCREIPDGDRGRRHQRDVHHRRIRQHERSFGADRAFPAPCHEGIRRRIARPVRQSGKRKGSDRLVREQRLYTKSSG